MHQENAASSRVRRLAVLRAGYIGDPSTATEGLSDREPAVRMAALRSLDRLGVLDSAIVQQALCDPDRRVRITALELAAPRAEPEITQLLDDTDPTVVEMAAWACGERTETEDPPIDRLSQLARDHEDPLVREAAVAALGALGHDRGLSAILSATTDKPAIRRRAVLALASFDGPEVDEAWQRARSDRDRQVRDAVEELLGPVDAD
jgi:HEAT repeat protein